MSDLINTKNYYYFIGGIVVGKTTGIISTVVISSILLYVVDPLIFTYANVTNGKDFIVDMIANITKSFKI